jgi:hypothetical protein
VAALAAAAQFPPAPDTTQSRHGVRGWLLFFCVSFTILWPVWVIPQYFIYHFVLSPFSVLGLLRLAFGIITGIGLWMTKPGAMALLRIYFVLSGLLAVLNVFSLILVAVRFHTLRFLSSTPVLWVTGSSLAFLAAGLLYFSLSERVRTTYGSKLFG